MRGRKPVPNELKKIRGNPGRRPISANSVRAKGLLIDAPEWMSDSQKASWNYIITSAPSQLLKLIDRDALVGYVVAQDLHRHAAQKIEKYGAIVKSPVKGDPMQSPWMAIMNKQAAIMIKVASELGFTPASRSRIQVADDAREDARPIDEFLN